MKDLQNGQEARAKMEAAKAESEKTFSADATPRKNAVYDKIKDHVSLRTVDIVIAVTALLILGFLAYGILTANT